MPHRTVQGVKKNKQAIEFKKQKQQNTDEVIEEVSKEKEELVDKNKSEQIVVVDDHELKLTNLKKIYWPAFKGNKSISKGEMLNYYFRIAEYMMPYMKDRPQSLN